MSKVEFRDRQHSTARHLASGRSGDLRVHDRVVTRGKGDNISVSVSFEAIFTFDEPIVCAQTDIPDNAGYFMIDGNAEVTQLIAEFTDADERRTWLEAQFGDG